MSNEGGARVSETSRELADLWRDTAAWFSAHFAEIVIGILAGALIFATLRFLRGLGSRLCKRGDGAGWPAVIGRAIDRTSNFFIIMVAAELVSHYARAPDPIGSTIRFLFTVAAVFQAAIWARELILGFIEQRSGAGGEHERLGSAMGIIRLLVTVALFAVAIVVVLDNLNVNVTGLVAGLGIGGIAIGLAAQGIIRDLFAALSILFDRPFRVGEMIKFGDATGRVEAIGLKTTRVRSLDGDQVIMSNAKLLDMEVRNLHGIAERRVVLTLPLQYANDPQTLEEAPERLRAVVEGLPHCRFGHAWLTEFRADAVALELMFHVTRGDAAARDRARHAAIIGAMRCLKELGVGLNYPAPPPEAA